MTCKLWSDSQAGPPSCNNDPSPSPIQQFSQAPGGETGGGTFHEAPAAYSTLPSSSGRTGNPIQFSENPGIYYFDYNEPADHYYYYDGPATWTEWCLEKLCCCCMESHPPEGPPADPNRAKMPWTPTQKQPLPAQQDPRGQPRPGKISKEIYQKIREVDNQSSTLTSSGVQGLSARVLDKVEYQDHLPDGTPETFVVQTVELVKKPGQSLGLYLREGNGIDCPDGVFVSRLSDQSELVRQGEIIRSLDEILTVNNVDVRHMSIDDVVVIMSIPRRLVLRLRFVKARRQMTGADYPSTSGLQHTSAGGGQQKPVVIVKQTEPEGRGIVRDESRESGLTDDAGPGPTPTAQTSLGIKARQQMEEIERQLRGGSHLTQSQRTMEANERTKLLNEGGRGYFSPGATAQQNFPPGASPHFRHQQGYLSTADASQSAAAAGRGLDIFGTMPRRALHGGRGVGPVFGPPARQQFGLHKPRILDSQGQLVPTTSASVQEFPVPHAANQGVPFHPATVDTVSLTARLPPPRLTSASTAIRRTESLRDPLLFAGSATEHGDPNMFPHPRIPRPDPNAMFSPRSVASDSLADYHRSFHSRPHSGLPGSQPPFSMGPIPDGGLRGPPPPLPPKPALRQPSAFPSHSQHPMGRGGGGGNFKSNSLPRRKVGGRTVKWKNDVMGGGMHPALALPGEPDSDGATSAPEFSLSPTHPHFAIAQSHRFPQAQYHPEWMSSRSGVEGRPSLLPQSGQPPPPFPFLPHHTTVDDIFSAQEYRAWAGGRGRPPPGLGNPNSIKYRSSSLPPRGILEKLAHHQHPHNTPGNRFSIPPSGPPGPPPMSQGVYPDPFHPSPIYANLPFMGGGPAQPYHHQHDKSVYTRLDVSPLLHRRGAPLQAVGTGWNVDGIQENNMMPPHSLPGPVPISGPPPGHPSGEGVKGLGTGPFNTGLLTAITGLLIVQILEGRGLKVPEKTTDEMYCVVEIDGEHKARTGVSTQAGRFRWNETFEIDVVDVRQMDIYVYSWHPQHRHKLCHRGSLKLLEAFMVDRLNGERRFALSLEPRGQLLVRINFLSLSNVFRRPLSIRRSAYFGMDIKTVVERENTGWDVPVVLRRLIEEIERRGVDSAGIYMLCGAAEKKKDLKDLLERDHMTSDLSPDAVPDTNILTSVLKDFLRELPEPLVPGCIFRMLVDGWRVCMPNDREGNARLMLGIVDCMPRIAKCTLMVLMDHFKCVTAQSNHNGMTGRKVGGIFGPLLACSTQPKIEVPPDIAASAAAAGIAPPPPIDPKGKSQFFLDPKLSADIFAILLDLWPGRASKETDANARLFIGKDIIICASD